MSLLGLEQSDTQGSSKFQNLTSYSISQIQLAIKKIVAYLTHYYFYSQTLLIPDQNLLAVGSCNKKGTVMSDLQLQWAKMYTIIVKQGSIYLERY